MSLCLYSKHFYKMLIDSEYLPNIFNAAALLLFIWTDNYFPSGVPSMYSKILLQRSKQGFGFPISR